MGFRFQRRINLTRGMGLNISKSGVSTSLRTRFGTIGSKGFSFRTGIPGLSYRHRFRKSSDGALVAVFVLALIALLPIIFAMLAVAARLTLLVGVWAVRILIIAPINILTWMVQSAVDYTRYRRGLVSRRRSAITQQTGPAPGKLPPPP